MARDNWVASMAVISEGRELPLRSEAFFNAHYLKNLYHDVAASFIKQTKNPLENVNAVQTGGVQSDIV